MRYPHRNKYGRGTARLVPLPAPVGGLNARDPISEMAEKDAIKLNNFFCTPYNVEVRKGYSEHNSGAPDQVCTLASYKAVSGVPKLFAWSSDDVYDCTSPGAVGTPVIEGNATNKFQTINFGTGGGVFLVGVSGEDLPLIYNGSVWSNALDAPFITTVTSITSVGTLATGIMANPHNLKTGMSVTITGFTPAGYNGTYVITVTGASTFTYVLAAPLGVTTVTGIVSPTLNITITGVDPRRFIQIAAFKALLWFIEKESSKAWYMPPASIGGAAAAIDFSSLFTRGGFLMAMANWSLDAGYGVDDYAVFVSSNGQVCVFRGTDPTSATTWELVGVYDIGSPVGRRCFHKYAGDLILISQDGLLILSQALMSTRVNSKTVLTDKVKNTISSYIFSSSAIFGWETILFPKNDMLLLNVPYSPTQSIQFVMNTISGAWSIFDGWNACCFVLHEDHIYFGGSNYVAKAWDTIADNGANINFEAQQAFSYCKSRSLKKVNLVRPVISSEGVPSISMGINVDYDMTDPTGIPTFSPTITALWDDALWDEGLWAGDLQINKNWQTAFAIGYALSPHLRGATNNINIQWSATDLILDDGGLL
jgi:hypothetical protein